MTTRIRGFGVFGFILLAGSLVGCGCAWRPGEWPTSVRLKGGTAPVFVLSGGGEVAVFTIYSPDYMTKAEKPDDENSRTLLYGKSSQLRDIFMALGSLSLEVLLTV